MDRSQKKELVDQVRETLVSSSSVILAQQVGLSVAEVTQLRRDMRAAGAELRVIKNTLAQIAIKDTQLEVLAPHFKGPTTVGFSKDPVAAARVLSKFAEKSDKLSIVAGMLDGSFLDSKSVKALADLPSLDELRAKLLGTLCAPATKLAVLAKEPATRVARVLGARS